MTSRFEWMSLLMAMAARRENQSEEPVGSDVDSVRTKRETRQKVL